jgi:ureidoglycolate hydrolase
MEMQMKPINEQINEKYKEIAELEQKLEDAKGLLQLLLHANSYIREYSGQPSMVP